MNEKELGAALVKLGPAALDAASGAQQLTWQILDRDRRRVRWWTALTIVAWIPAVLLSLGILVYLGLLFPLQAKLYAIRDAQAADAARGEAPPHGETIVHNGREINLAELERGTEIGFRMMAVLSALAVLALSLAMLSSLMLLFASRRATLRQINATLLVLSEQLKGEASGYRSANAK